MALYMMNFTSSDDEDQNFVISDDNNKKTRKKSNLCISLNSKKDDKALNSLSSMPTSATTSEAVFLLSDDSVVCDQNSNIGNKIFNLTENFKMTIRKKKLYNFFDPSKQVYIAKKKSSKSSNVSIAPGSDPNSMHNKTEAIVSASEDDGCYEIRRAPKGELIGSIKHFLKNNSNRYKVEFQYTYDEVIKKRMKSIQSDEKKIVFSDHKHSIPLITVKMSGTKKYEIESAVSTDQIILFGIVIAISIEKANCSSFLVPFNEA